jgi:hypothetical protein
MTEKEQRIWDAAFAARPEVRSLGEQRGTDLPRELAALERRVGFMIPEIRFDHMTDRALLDCESTAALHALSCEWARGHSGRATMIRRGWRAMAALRMASTVRVYSERPNVRNIDVAPVLPVGEPEPFPLVRTRRPAYGRWAVCAARAAN